MSTPISEKILSLLRDQTEQMDIFPLTPKEKKALERSVQRFLKSYAQTEKEAVTPELGR